MAETQQNEVRIEPDAEIERLKNDLGREHEMYLRSLADFENYRRRADRESSRAGQRGRRDLVLSLLDLLDSFDLALPFMADAPSGVAQGLAAIHRKFLDLLDREGVRPFSSIGEPFDPALHEAVGSVRNEQYGQGQVAEEVRRGYRLGDEVLRPARVRVGL